MTHKEDYLDGYMQGALDAYGCCCNIREGEDFFPIPEALRLRNQEEKRIKKYEENQDD